MFSKRTKQATVVQEQGKYSFFYYNFSLFMAFNILHCLVLLYGTVDKIIFSSLAIWNIDCYYFFGFIVIYSFCVV